MSSWPILIKILWSCIQTFLVPQFACSLYCLTEGPCCGLTVEHMTDKCVLSSVHNESCLLYIDPDTKEGEESDPAVYGVCTIREMDADGAWGHTHMHSFPIISAYCFHHLFDCSINCIHTSWLRHLKASQVPSCNIFFWFFHGCGEHILKTFFLQTHHSPCLLL